MAIQIILIQKTKLYCKLTIWSNNKLTQNLCISLIEVEVSSNSIFR